MHYSIDPGTATTPDDFSAVPMSGILKFGPGATLKYVLVKINGDTIAESNETFTVDLSQPTPGWDLRRSSGIGTIIDDDSGPVAPTVAIGDASIPEGDVGGTHIVKIPLTLSNPVSGTVTVTVILSTVSAIHRVPHVLGDWGGPIKRSIRFAPNQLRANVSIPTYPDVVDEPNLMISATIISVTSTAGVTVSRSAGTATILSDE